MEMVPIRRRGPPTGPRRALLDDEDVFRDEWSPPPPGGNQQHQRRQRRRRRGDGRLVSPPTNYHAPQVPGVSPFFPQEEPQPLPYLTGSAQGQTLVEHIHHNLLQQTNPAQDLSISCISYGCLCVQCVRTQEIGLTENFGKFDLLLEPGFYCMAWPYSNIAARLSLRVQQLDVVCETKTKDNVFLHISTCVQYRVIPEMAYYAYYRLANPQLQIRSYVFDVVRATVPTLNLDALFVSKETVATAIHQQLYAVMHDYGYEILDSLCTNIVPTPTVKQAMNEVEACRREKLATPYQAEANKILTLKAAEGLAESKYLSGVGTANQRTNIVKGLKESANTWGNVEGMDFSQVMDLLLLTQYSDMLAHVGSNNLMLRATPGECMEIRQGLEEQRSEKAAQRLDATPA